MLAVAQNADIVAQIKYFIQAMRDIDDGDALFTQLTNDAEHNIQLTVGQNGGGFIHNENLGIVVDGVHDFNNLLLRNGE